VFAAQGWEGTRVEDVARRAGVSVPTAYQHFRSKHALIGHVYAPLLEPCFARARRQLTADVPVTEVLEDHVRDVIATIRKQGSLTVALVAAAQDYSIRTGAPPRVDDEADPRNIVPVPATIVDLIRRGQECGELRPYPPAEEIGALVVNLLFIMTLTRPTHSTESVTEMILTTLFGVLDPQRLISSGLSGRPFHPTSTSSAL
jgi:AcrR family transcriptional regulator